MPDRQEAVIARRSYLDGARVTRRVTAIPRTQRAIRVTVTRDGLPPSGLALRLHVTRHGEQRTFATRVFDIVGGEVVRPDGTPATTSGITWYSPGENDGLTRFGRREIPIRDLDVEVEVVQPCTFALTVESI